MLYPTEWTKKGFQSRSCTWGLKCSCTRGHSCFQSGAILSVFPKNTGMKERWVVPALYHYSRTSSSNNSWFKHSLGQQLFSPLGALAPGHPIAAYTLMVEVLSHHDGNRILSLLHTGIETKLAFHVCQLASCEEAASPSTVDLTAANLGLWFLSVRWQNSTLTLDIQSNNHCI